MAFAVTVTTATSPQVAHAADQLNWYSTDRDLVADETISGNKRVILQTNFEYSGRYVKKWCIYLDGELITGRSYESDFDAPSPAASYPVYIYYENGVVSRGAGDQTSPGCWTTVSADRSSGFDITLNTTTWANGSHEVRIEAIVSDTVTLSKSTTITSTNTAPSVEWITPGPLTATSTMSLTAKITPRTNRIAKACLMRDGVAIQRSEQTSFSGDTRYDGTWGGPYGTFGSETGGCVLFNLSQDSGWPAGLRQVTTLTISLKTSTWTQIPAALTLTVTESIGREFSTAISFNPSPDAPLVPDSPSTPDTPSAPDSSSTPDTPPVSNSPTTPDTKSTTPNFVSWNFTGVSEGQILTGWADIDDVWDNKLSRSSNVELCLTGITTGRSCGQNHVVNTACFNDGAQVITATLNGEAFQSGRSILWTETKSYNVAITNPVPIIESAKATSKKPNWKSSTTSGYVTLRYKHGCNYTVSIKAAKSKAKTYKGTLSADSTSVSFSGLKPKTKYTAKTSVVSTKGTKTKNFTFTTPAIPARPRSSSGGGGGSGGGSGGGVASVIGWPLDRALAVGSFYSKQYSFCDNLRGYENGFFGILDPSNWVVVDQSGSTLYSCKRK